MDSCPQEPWAASQRLVRGAPWKLGEGAESGSSGKSVEEAIPMLGALAGSSQNKARQDEKPLFLQVMWIKCSSTSWPLSSARSFTSLNDSRIVCSTGAPGAGGRCPEAAHGTLMWPGARPFRDMGHPAPCVHTEGLAQSCGPGSFLQEAISGHGRMRRISWPDQHQG